VGAVEGTLGSVHPGQHGLDSWQRHGAECVGCCHRHRAGKAASAWTCPLVERSDPLCAGGLQGSVREAAYILIGDAVSKVRRRAWMLGSFLTLQVIGVGDLPQINGEIVGQQGHDEVNQIIRRGLRPMVIHFLQVRPHAEVESPADPSRDGPSCYIRRCPRTRVTSRGRGPERGMSLGRMPGPSSSIGIPQHGGQHHCRHHHRRQRKRAGGAVGELTASSSSSRSRRGAHRLAGPRSHRALEGGLRMKFM
jgi:hypothetical protein